MIYPICRRIYDASADAKVWGSRIEWAFDWIYGWVLFLGTFLRWMPEATAAARLRRPSTT